MPSFRTLSTLRRRDHGAANGLVGRLRSWMLGRRRRKLRRDAVRTLLKVDDSILADIGIDRREVERAAFLQLPAEADRGLLPPTRR